MLEIDDYVENLENLVIIIMWNFGKYIYKFMKFIVVIYIIYEFFGEFMVKFI